jgi:hypothetical protein
VLAFDQAQAAGVGRMIKLHHSITRRWPEEKTILVLRQTYDRVLDEPVPEDMKDLLAKMK